ncbi:MAG: hypothetical protein L0Y58_16770 [Verrucomicrobia subdivision 3 bacterium]|nr:hypothetical protein [Limisphaerales bacterium]
MRKLFKILGLTSIILVAASFTGPGSEILWGGLKPLGAVLFIASFIGYLLAGEYEKYDAEHQRRGSKSEGRERSDDKRESEAKSLAREPAMT